MRRNLYILVGLTTGLLVLTNCGTDPAAKNSVPNVKAARAISTHYVLVEFAEPANEMASDPANYLIVDPERQLLRVNAVTVSTDRNEAILATEEQAEVQYQIAMGNMEQLLSLGRTLPIGTLGFFGTSQREPFLESAVSLSSTQILMTFSQQMDPETAQNAAFYEIADPDDNTDIDIRVTGAVLQPDFTTVILTTTPQQNLEYEIRATNIKRRFTCEDGGRIFLDNAAQGTTCAGNYRPKDAEGILSSFVLTARTQIDRNAPLNPNATGVGGSVGLEANGAGVRRPLCNGGTTGIDGANGTDPDEELIFTADRPEKAENIVIGVKAMDAVVDIPVLFISTDASPGFDITVDTAAIRAAFSTGATSGDIVFANIPALAGKKIDIIKLRETNGEIWVNSVCGLAVNRRLIDPTRNIARFFGIPAVDTDGPRVVRVESTSDTEIIVYFSEPVDSEAANPANFTITPDLTVVDARLGAFDTQVILTTSPQHVDVEYMVTVMNVHDKAGNLIEPTANSATFFYLGGPASLGADALPRVVGAASTGNTGVLVTFTKPMGPSAESAGNYVIVQQNVNPEVGTLVIMSAAFVPGQQNAVQLVTGPQNEVTYFLRVVNVLDLSGNQLAPPQLLVEPATALFPGTPFSCDGEEDSHCHPPDADHDHVPDYLELRGYVVKVELTNGDEEERQVTSNPAIYDTDNDGLSDGLERLIGCDPRLQDTDDDLIYDFVEYNFVYSNTNKQDSDDDGIDDFLEVDFFKTNANLDDSDGDGFEDGEELYVMNRDPRISDLPHPRMNIEAVDLHLQELFTYVDEQGVVRTENSSTQSTLSLGRTSSVSSSQELHWGLGIKGNVEGGYESPFKWFIKGGLGIDFNIGQSFTSSQASSESTMEAFQQSLSKGISISNSTSFTRNVVGARIDALVNLGNLSDVAFSLSNLEITVSAPDPVDRTSFVPIATLVPNKTLVTGEPATYNIGVLNNSARGPIMFSSRDVFPALVEDLMRDPRGLLFEFANYDLTDEFDRNFAYASQQARDRTLGLVIDFGDGVPKRYLVAYAPVRFHQDSCDPEADPGCDIVGGFAGFSNAGIPPYGGLGEPPGLPLEYILEEVLQKRHSQPVITPMWLPQPLALPEMEDGDPVDPDGILVGGNGVSDSIAQGDDVQLIPFGIDGLPEDAVVINAGENGLLESTPQPNDVAGIITGYSTTKTCGPGTPSSIRPGPNGIVDTIRDPSSDDQQIVSFDTSMVDLATDIIGPGANGFIDTAPAGDDVYVGPGLPCDDDADCVAPGVCDGQETLFRFEHRARGQFRRIWGLIVPEDSLIGTDFRKIVLHPGQVLNLGFIQDLDRDGLIANVESLFGSSDTRQDTDGDGLDDFSEVRVGWEIGVEGNVLRRVFPDPRLADSDRDGLGDREEQDMRRVQCECVGGPDDGEACNRNLGALDPEEFEGCRGGGSCMNIADDPPSSCSRVVTDNRLDPRRRDTDGDFVGDADEVLGWLTQAAVIDPKHVIIAGNDRVADTQACPMDVCMGGSNDGNPCRFQRDCPPEKLCDGGINVGNPCVNDVECQGPTSATSGLCNVTAAEHECIHTGCDDVQVVAKDTVGLDKRAVVVAPGPNGTLETAALAGDSMVADGDDLAQTPALRNDQQIALVDPARMLLDTPLGRTIIRPGIDGEVDSLPKGDDVVALGQFLKTTDPLGPDTDRDQISEGIERILGSDPRDATDGGFLGDRDGDGLTDGQEEVVGWIVTANGGPAVDLHSNPNAPDSDLDGLPDYAEFVLRTDPNEADTDGDGLSDFDEVSNAQLTELEKFNTAFPNYVLVRAASAKYGTNPLSCDTDGDHLTDKFEVLVGWNVTVDEEDGVVVRHVRPDPTKMDTDGDGLDDGGEYKHMFDGDPAPPTDPTKADTDGDERVDGKECSNHAPAPALADCTNPAMHSLGSCLSDPLVQDKRVTIRYTQMTVDRGNNSDWSARTVDLTWRFQAQKSDEVYPGDWYGVRTARSDCIAVSGDAFCREGGYCSVPAGSDFIFQGPHCRYHGLGFLWGLLPGGASCLTDADCPMVGYCSLFPFITCSNTNDCPLPGFLGNSCVGLVADTCDGGNEVSFTLHPGEGILLNGEASMYNNCRGAECTSGPFAGALCDPFNHEVFCCPKECTNIGGACVGDFQCSACVGGPNVGDACSPFNFVSACGCPKFCTGTTDGCTNNGDCTGPATCDFDCTGISCVAPAGSCDFACGGITCEAPYADNHIIYTKGLSYESLQEGFSVDVAQLSDNANMNSQFAITLIVEILVE